MKEFSVDLVYDGIELTVTGRYTPHIPGVAYAAPEDCYEQEGGIEEFDILIGDESIYELLSDKAAEDIEELAWKQLQASE